MRRFVAALTAGAVILAGSPAHAGNAVMGDLANHWARTSVESGVSAGYIAGYPDGSFKPDRTITRAEFFKLLTGALGHSGTQTGTEFTDSDHWAFAQGTIQAAVGAGLLFPPDYGTQFGPDTPIARREIVLAAVRALGKQPLVDEKNAVLGTADAASYETWLKGWAVVAMRDGIIGGYPDGSLGLNRTATRAEALVMVQRILSKVTMELTEFEADYKPGMVRHPGEGEPFWYVDGEVTLRPTITNGTQRYTFTEDAWGLSLVPAEGGALWVSYVVNGPGGSTYGVLGRLAGGKLTEVTRAENRSLRLFDVDASGRLWFSDLQQNLMLADARGQIVATHEVGPIEQADLAFDGTLWAYGVQNATTYKLLKISTTGAAATYTGQLTVAESLSYLAAGDDGSVWLLTNIWNPASGYAEARQYVDGREVRRLPLLNRYMVGSEYAGTRVVGRSGPYLWTVTTEKVDPYTAGVTGFYKLDLTTGAFTPQVAPRSLSEGFGLLTAPGSGALIRDTAGQFWRILP